MARRANSKQATESEAVPGAAADAQQLAGWSLDKLDYPTFRIGLLAKVMDRLTIRLLAEQDDLTYAEWRVLARLAATPDGMTVRQVADLAWVDRAEVSRAMGALESRGLTGRRDNPKDRRAPFLFLTAKGAKHYRATVEWRSAFHESLLGDLSAVERATLDALLGRIGTRLMELLESRERG